MRTDEILAFTRGGARASKPRKWPKVSPACGLAWTEAEVCWSAATPHQVTEGVPGRLGTGVLSPGDHDSSRAGSVPVPWSLVRRIFGSGDTEEPSQPRPAEGALPFSGSAGAWGRLSFSEQPGWSVDGRV